MYQGNYRFLVNISKVHKRLTLNNETEVKVAICLTVLSAGPMLSWYYMCDVGRTYWPRAHIALNSQ